MRELCGDTTALPPQICNADTYCGVWEMNEILNLKFLQKKLLLLKTNIDSGCSLPILISVHALWNYISVKIHTKIKFYIMIKWCYSMKRLIYSLLYFIINSFTLLFLEFREVWRSSREWRIEWVSKIIVTWIYTTNILRKSKF